MPSTGTPTCHNLTFVASTASNCVPPWIDVVVTRYNEKYGKRRASSLGDDAPPVYTHQQVHIDLADYPVKPSGTPALAGSTAAEACVFF